MSAVFECETMTSTQKLVALALADHCHDDGTEARPGMARLRAKTALGERAVQRTLQSLLRDGFLTIQRKSTPVTPVVYQFVLGGVFETGGVSTTGGGLRAVTPCLKVIPPPSDVRPNHHEPSLNHGTASISDISVPMPKNFRTSLGLRKVDE